jgi:hypothetical protein
MSLARQRSREASAPRQRPALKVPRVPPAYRRRGGNGARWVWTGCIALVAVVVAAGAWATVSRAPAPVPAAPYTGPIDGIPCVAAPATGQAFRVHLDIWIGERAMEVPPGTGTVSTQDGTCQYYLTSPAGPSGKADNIVAVAAPAGQSFTLGQFFAIWGLPLSATDLMGHVTYGAYSLRAYVDGRPYSGNPADIPLRPGEEIALEYGPPWHSPVPASYAFPQVASGSGAAPAAPSSTAG